ncbi:hypothetical protein EBR21_15680 [bacterium]|nr:hypothetical protein [bacterium]
MTPQHFPCQKPDADAPCLGWTLVADTGFAAPGVARPCPCISGRGMLLGGVVEVAHEFVSVEGLPTPAPMVPKISPFMEVLSREDFLHALITWMWLAASRSFPSAQPCAWIEEIDPAKLPALQRKSMRWWARLVELSALVDNQKFSVVMRSSLEFLCKESHLVALQDYLDRMQANEERFLVLALNGSPLSPTGMHSLKNDWFETFISMLDDRCLGLCIISKQPLLSDGSGGLSRSKGEYRWKAKHQLDGAKFSLQEVLKRGTWDRMCEALARSEHQIAGLSSF